MQMSYKCMHVKFHVFITVTSTVININEKKNKYGCHVCITCEIDLIIDVLN